jgi:hypothetical protein
MSCHATFDFTLASPRVVAEATASQLSPTTVCSFRRLLSDMYIFQHRPSYFTHTGGLYYLANNDQVTSIVVIPLPMFLINMGSLSFHEIDESDGLVLETRIDTEVNWGKYQRSRNQLVRNVQVPLARP